MVREHVARVTDTAPESSETLREYLRRVGRNNELEDDAIAALTRTLEREAFGPGETDTGHVDRLLAEHGVIETPIEEAEPGHTPEQDGPPADDGASIDSTGPPEEWRSLDAPSSTGTDGDGTDTPTPVPAPQATATEATAAIRRATGDAVEVIEGSVPGDSETVASAASGGDETAVGEVGVLPRSPTTEPVSPLERLVPFVPAVVLVALVTAPVPGHLQATREVAVTFQSLAFVEEGLGAYGLLTVRELPASLHLHSLLSAPLVGLGYVAGPRLVSAVAAVATTALVAAIATRLFGPRAGLLAPAVLWANPYFLRFAWAAMPEMTSIALTTGAVYGALRAVEDGGWGWLGVTAALVALAVANSVWALSLALPVVVYLLMSGRESQAGIVAAAAVWAAAIVLFVVQSGPTIPGQGFAVTATGPGIYLTAEWLGYWARRFTLSPFQAARGLLFVGGVVLAGGWLWRARGAADGDRATPLLLGTWALAGLVLPLALPAGSLDNNPFYVWGVVVPFALTLAWLGSRAVERFERDASGPRARTGLRVAVGVLVVLALVNGAVVDAGLGVDEPLDSRASVVPFDTGPGEARAAGLALREYDVAPAEVTFVGDWALGEGVYTGGVSRVLLYGGVVPTGAWELAPGESSGPGYARTTAAADDCTVRVVRFDTGAVRVQSCP